MIDTAHPNDDFGARLTRGAALNGDVQVRGHWQIECRDAEGNLKWSEPWENLVTNQGKDHLLDVTLSAATQLTTWYVGLISGASPTIAAADTMSSHAGWTEFTGYSQATRVTWTDGGVSSQSVSNSGSVASFSINAGGTVGGAFLVSNSTKSGTTGTLYAAGTFASARTVASSDTLTVTATFTMS